MARKKSTRSAESYTGNTEEAKINQRRNLIPGNTFNKRRIKEMKLDCWWDNADLKSKQFIYEGWENDQDSDKVAKDELKEETELYPWWNRLDVGLKKAIYNSIMEVLSGERKTGILDNIDECIKEKLEVEKAKVRSRNEKISQFPL